MGVKSGNGSLPAVMISAAWACCLFHFPVNWVFETGAGRPEPDQRGASSWFVVGRWQVRSDRKLPRFGGFDRFQRAEYGGGMTFISRRGAVASACGLLVAVTLAGVASAQRGRSSSAARGTQGVVASPRIAVVMESSAGNRPAKRVRRLMAKHLGLAVGGLDSPTNSSGKQSTGERSTPDAIVAIVATGKRDISVHYWDRTGRTDSLTAPLPKGHEQLSLVSASLAVAVVRKHVGGLRQALLAWRPASRGHGSLESGRGSRVPRAVQQFLGRVATIRHRTELLTEADF